MRSRFNAGAVVDDLDVDLAAFVVGAQQQAALGRLAACTRASGVSMP